MNPEIIRAIDHASANLKYEPAQAELDTIQRVAGEGGRAYRELRESVERVAFCGPRMLDVLRSSPALNDQFGRTSVRPLCIQYITLY